MPSCPRILNSSLLRSASGCWRSWRALAWIWTWWVMSWPWILPVGLFLHYAFVLIKPSIKKETTNPITYQQSYLERILDYPSYEQIFHRWLQNGWWGCCCGSILQKLQETVCLSSPWLQLQLHSWTACYNHYFSCKTCHHSKQKPFLIVSDSLSALQATHDLKYDHPAIIKIHELYLQLIQEKREVVFVWVPGHVGIRGNSVAGSAAKDALLVRSQGNSSPFPILIFVWITIFWSSGNVDFD